MGTKIQISLQYQILTPIPPLFIKSFGLYPPIFFGQSAPLANIFGICWKKSLLCIRSLWLWICWKLILNSICPSLLNTFTSPRVCDARAQMRFKDFRRITFKMNSACTMDNHNVICSKIRLYLYRHLCKHLIINHLFQLVR